MLDKTRYHTDTLVTISAYWLSCLREGVGGGLWNGFFPSYPSVANVPFSIMPHPLGATRRGTSDLKPSRPPVTDSGACGSEGVPSV